MHATLSAIVKKNTMRHKDVVECMDVTYIEHQNLNLRSPILLGEVDNRLLDLHFPGVIYTFKRTIACMARLPVIQGELPLYL